MRTAPRWARVGAVRQNCHRAHCPSSPSRARRARCSSVRRRARPRQPIRKPFQGRAGKTLFRWLAHAGLDEPAAREFFWIAAVTRCYPGPHPGGRGDRVPTPGERARCAPWLDAEFALVRPAFVVTLGRLAVDRFLAPAPLTALVGRVHTATIGGHAVPVLPLPHPSGASGWLNVVEHRALLEQALGVLAEEVQRLRRVQP